MITLTMPFIWLTAQWIALMKMGFLIEMAGGDTGKFLRPMLSKIEQVIR